MNESPKVKKMTQEEKRRIAEALKEREAIRACPRCGNDNFSLIDGYFNTPFRVELKGLVIGGPSIPAAVVVCKKCGYLSQHALGVLGLLPKSESKENE